jgi:hypothetical protein
MQKKFEFSETDMNLLLDNLTPDEVQEFHKFMQSIISKSIKWYCSSLSVKKNVKWHNLDKLSCEVHYGFQLRRKKI